MAATDSSAADQVLPHEAPRLELYIFVSSEDGECWFKTRHRFVDRPEISTINALFSEAKEHFATLYEGVEASDFTVDLDYLDDPASGASRR